MSPDEYRQLVELAEDREWSLSLLVRELVREAHTNRFAKSRPGEPE